MLFAFILVLAFLPACARVEVRAPKEPIKVDISMRLDIYQHIQKDIDAVENIVSGTKGKSGSKGNGRMPYVFLREAYAEEGLSPAIEAAALRRRDRHNELDAWERKGVIGENRLGFAEKRKPDETSPFLNELIAAENRDRMLIYEAIARKNGIAVEEVQALYAKRLQADASPGTPIEVLNEKTGSYEWRIKQ